VTSEIGGQRREMLKVDNIGARLRTLRRARAMTQKDLSEASGVAVSTIVDIERGKSEPQIRTIRQLARALNVTPERLVIGED
jgi:transcriptional regulator with XRE-family HTH domain